MSRSPEARRSVADLAEDVKKLTVPQLLAAASLSAQGERWDVALLFAEQAVTKMRFKALCEKGSR